MLNYWWMTRPKRKLNPVPEVLAAFSNVALESRWAGARDVHIRFEEELERDGLKRVGERRDHSGSGGRTYQAWLYSLGLIFFQESTGIPYLTLAGEAILAGKSPVAVLKEQVLKYQFPSSFSLKTHVAERFKVHPFIFLLRLLEDSRIGYLTQEEIAKVVITEGESDSDKCLESVVQKVLAFRDSGDASLPKNFIYDHTPSTGRVNSDHPYSHLMDVANTIMNWLEYTQLTFRDEKKIMVIPEKADEIKRITSAGRPFIGRPEESEYFQRRYGVDPWHVKDTRNLLDTQTVSSKIIDTQRIKQTFIAYAAHRPISQITHDLILEIATSTGTDQILVENVLYKEYPHGATGAFLASYFDMAFKGTEEAVDFEKATTELFQNVFKYNATHLGQTGSKSAPDILLVSDSEGYQSIIDNKAYSKYSITGDHHNRMVHNYIEKISNYSTCSYPIGFFTYIAGGFGSTFDKQIMDEVKESGCHGSGITVTTFIKMVENQTSGTVNYSHADLRKIFGLDRQVHLSDIE